MGTFVAHVYLECSSTSAAQTKQEHVRRSRTPGSRCISKPLVSCHMFNQKHRALMLRTQELILSENKLQEIPESLAHLKALRIMRLQNNRLKTLPHAMGAVITLEELDCAGNPDLDVVPAPLHSDTAMILWVCRLHKGMIPKVGELTTAVFTSHKKNVLLDFVPVFF